MLKTKIRIPYTINSILKGQVYRISAKSLLVVMAVVIFFVEMLVMFLLSAFPPLSREWEALLDSTVLLLLLTPFYLYIYRPFWVERQRQEIQIRSLSQQLLSSTEEESKRIAHDIHDQCGQTLTALQLGIQTLKNLLVKQDPSALTRADSLEKIASQLSEELRDLTTRLRPPILDEAGIRSAVKWQVMEFRRNFPDIIISVRLSSKADFPPSITVNQKNAIYRLCQEALTNVARHASATEVQLEMIAGAQAIDLKVEDNGQGFDLDYCLSQRGGVCGLGLLGMRERALMVGAKFKVISEPGKGTAIVASFPFKVE